MRSNFIYKQDAIEAVERNGRKIPTFMIRTREAVEALPEVDEVEVLSEIRSRYNCFDPCERPVYHALSECIRAIKERRE